MVDRGKPSHLFRCDYCSMFFFSCCKMKLFRTVIVAFFIGCLAASCSIGQKHSTADNYIKDASITTNVKAAIFLEAELGTSVIGVSTYCGTVTLSGEVPAPSLIARATEVASAVEGVKRVRNRLKVKRNTATPQE